MMAYQHPNMQQQQQHQVQPGPQHLQGHPGQPNAVAMPHMHPQQYQQQLAALAANQGGLNPQLVHQQALLVRQRQQLMNGMANNPGAMAAFQNPNASQMRALPNGMYPASAPGGVPGNMAAFAAGNHQLRMFPPQMQQQLQQQAHQQHQIAAAQQYTLAANQAAAAQGNPQAPAMNMPQQGQQLQMGTIQQQQQQAMQRQAQQQAQQAALARRNNLALVRLHQFSDSLSIAATNQTNDLNYWRKFVSDFYSPVGVMRQGLVHNQKNELKQFEITTNLLARYYYTLYESGIRTVQMIVEKPRDIPVSGGGCLVESAKTTFIYWFDNDCHLVAIGTLRVHFNQSLLIDMLDFTTHTHKEYVSRASMNELVKQGSPEMMKMSPGGKSLGKRPQRVPPSIPESIMNGFGIPPMVLSLLENAETFSQMKELIVYSQQNPQLGPTQALLSLVQQQQIQAQHHAQQVAAQQQHHQQQQQQQQQQLLQQQHAQGIPNVNGPMPRSVMPGGPGAPGMPHGPGQQLGIPMTNSPSVGGDIRMGGVQSPHIVGGGATPSPAQNHMQAPGMIAQQSQHQHPTSNPSSQTSTTVGSANTSPHQTNKRRRASTASNANNEVGDGGVDGGMNGVAAQKIKQSPRVGANKRTKLSN